MGEEAEVEREILQDRMIALVVLEEGEVIKGKVKRGYKNNLKEIH